MQTKTKEAEKFKVVRDIIAITVKYMQLFHSDLFFLLFKIDKQVKYAS